MTFLTIFVTTIRAKKYVFGKSKYIKSHVTPYRSFSRTLFDTFDDRFRKIKLVRTPWYSQGVQKVCGKKSYSPFSVSQGEGGGKAAVQSARAQQ